MPTPPPGFEPIEEAVVAGTAQRAIPRPPSGFEPIEEPQLKRGGVLGMFSGKQDPKFKDLPGAHGLLVQDQDQEVLDAIASSDLWSADDARHGDVVKHALGDRFLGRQQDENGYDVLTWRGRDGQEKSGYINRPGLDLEDVRRFVTGSTPYLAAGGLVGQGLRAASFPVRAFFQGAAQGATSVGTDMVSTAAGSEQGVDSGRALLTSTLGAAGEGVATVAPMIWRRFITEPKYFDRGAGRLTALGEQAAKEAGVDPASLTGELGKHFAKTYARDGGNPQFASGAWADQEFAIPSTRGQRTKDAAALLEEKAMRYGTYGDGAKNTLMEFDRLQGQAIADAATTGGEGRGIANILTGRDTPAGLGPNDLGENIRSGIQAANQGARAQERAAWKRVDELTPMAEAFDELPAAIQSQLGTMKVDERLTPLTMMMGKELDDYAAGQLPSAAGAKVFGAAKPLTMDQMRRRLLTMYRSAERGSADEKAAKAVYDGFNGWLGDTAQKGLVNGDPASAAAMLTARDITKTIKSIFSPQGAGGRVTPSGRLMGNILDESGSVSADSLISKMFGTNPKAAPKDGTLDALNRIKHGLKRYGDPKTANDVWNDVRVANWMRLVQNKEGEMFTPGVMLGNVRAAMQSQRSVMNVLYTTEEQAAIQRFAHALGRVVARDPNPSGSGVAIAALTRQFLMKVIEAVPYGRVALEYSGLPNAYGRAVAKRAVNQAPLANTNGLPVAGAFGSMARQRSSEHN